jgi:RNA polymerase sigma factor (sigma-70 family)
MSEGLNTRREEDEANVTFAAARTRLLSIAYRMLASWAEAEDVVQEAYLKWHALDHSTLRTPVAWLTTVVTRLSIDRLRHLQLERRIGEHAPQPSVDDFAPSAETLMLRTSELSRGLSLLLERLSPEERAALVLHEAFDCSYSEIGLVLSKTAQTCRQIVHRAKVRLHAREQSRDLGEKSPLEATRRPALKNLPRLPGSDKHPRSPERDDKSRLLRRDDKSRAPQRSEVTYLRGSATQVPAQLLAQLRDAIENQDKEAFIGLMAVDAQAAVAVSEPQSQPVLTQTTIAQANAGSTSMMSGASFAELVMKIASTGEVAEAMEFNGRCGLALMNGCEPVAILYLEARGDWIARCYLASLPGHLNNMDRGWDLRVERLSDWASQRENKWAHEVASVPAKASPKVWCEAAVC